MRKLRLTYSELTCLCKYNFNQRHKLSNDVVIPNFFPALWCRGLPWLNSSFLLENIGDCSRVQGKLTRLLPLLMSKKTICTNSLGIQGFVSEILYWVMRRFYVTMSRTNLAWQCNKNNIPSVEAHTIKNCRNKPCGDN